MTFKKIFKKTYFTEHLRATAFLFVLSSCQIPFVIVIYWQERTQQPPESRLTIEKPANTLNYIYLY